MTLIVLLGSSQAYGQSRSGQNALVEKVLDNMVNSNTMYVSSYISPDYLTAHSVSASDYKINTYSPTGYSVDENKGNGVVVARIWGSNRSWVHRLTFIVSYENGSYYFIPGREPSTYSYIDPWYIVEKDVKDEGGSSKPTTSESRALVTDLLYDMVNNQDDFETDARKYIAPSYYRTNYLDKSEYKINRYSPTGAEIKSVGEDGIVEAYIYGSDKSWVHLLTFKVVKEGGKAYSYTKGHTDNNYIHPWYIVETDVDYSSGGTDPKAREKKELVDKICNAMVNSNDDFGTAMRLYIAPSYYKSNSIDPFTYQVNSYSPKGYSVGSVDSRGYIKAKIWGTDRGWVHELTFKVVEKSGLI